MFIWCLTLWNVAGPKYSEPENSLIVKQENDFTPLNITFIQLKVSPQKDSNDYKYSIDIKSWLLFFFFLNLIKIENNWIYYNIS